MSNHRTRLRDTRSWWFDLSLCVSGLALFAWTLPAAWSAGYEAWLAALIGVPLTVLVARFPMVLDSEDGGIEIGFDSIVLIFLLCTFDAGPALAVWGLGVVATQLISGKRVAAIVFNIGVGTLAGALAAGAVHLTRGSVHGTVRELAAVVAAATVYFFVDYVLSAISVAMDSETPLRGQLVQPGTWLAVACFVPFDLLGYLAAVEVRNDPWWTVLLLGVPLATLLISTRAIVHSRENARRLRVLFEAAVRVQALHEPGLVIEGLLIDARRLIRLREITVRGTPPTAEEIGAQVRRGKDALYVVAPARDRARSTVGADQHALDALAVICSEAFARLQLTDEMVHYARHDPLTDLPNRGILLDRVAHALHLARRRGVRVALLFIDLDGFKPVNDRFGHAVGDAVLIEVARRLGENTRDSDTVARLGGDEFAVLLEDVTVGEVVEISERILASLSSGAVVAGHPVPLGASIGIAYGDGSESGEALLRHADLAMYEAKGRGKAQHVQYEPAIGRARMERLELVDELRAAIEQRQLRVVYQPVCAASSGRIVGVEALARWELEGRNIPADAFIRIAEDTDLMVPLGRLILEMVAQDAPAMREAAGRPISVSVNVSARQLQDPTFVTDVERALETIDRTGLVLEITERQELSEGMALEAMRVIAAMGVRFAVDDFGVGFSSISYLRDLPVHVVKTDAALAQNIDHDARAETVLRAVSVMADALGLDVVVEGVEREGQLAVVRDRVRAPFVQGYLLHRPMPLPALLDVVRSNRQPAAAPAAPAGAQAEPDEPEDRLAPVAL